MAQFWRPADKTIDRDGSEGSILHNNKHKHLSLQQQRQMLPIFRFRAGILQAVENHSAVILVGETGCGKSTQLPLYLHENGWTADGNAVVCTQPRRMAAISVAKRVADEYGCVLGEQVGYGVRFDFNCSSQTRIKYYTDGVLLRETLSDPLLEKYSVIIVDEAHQRSLHSDILLGLLKKIQRKRPELRIIVTSATLDALAFKNFFESNLEDDKSKDTATIISIQGRQHPVDILYLSKSTNNFLRSAVDTVKAIHKSEDWGDILVFLPGSEDIDQVIEMLNQEYEGDTMYFLPLHSTLPQNLQMQVFDPTPMRMRKVVVATNIAETSITIEGIRFVVDCGFVKLNYFDVTNGIDALITCPVSKAIAIQRAGRAGRTQSGKCFRLMTEPAFDDLQEHTLAEIQRVDITWAVLQLKALGINDIVHFDFLSPPSVDALIYGLELLFSLGGIDMQGKITPKGEKMAEMPIEPRLATSLLASLDMGCSEELLSIAAMCSVEYPFITIRSKGAHDAKAKLNEDIEEFSVKTSDHLTLLNIYSQFQQSGYQQSWCDGHSLQYRILHRAKEIRTNLMHMLRRFLGEGEVLASCGQDDATIRKCLIIGYFSNLAKLGNDGKYHTIRGNALVEPHPTSVIALFGAPPEWIIYNEVYLSKTTQLREITRIDPMWLLDYAKHYYALKL